MSNNDKIKWCKVCGRIIPASSSKRCICSEYCRSLSKQGHAAYLDAPRMSLSLSETAKLARMQKKSYGKYVAEHEFPVKVRRPQKSNEGGDK